MTNPKDESKALTLRERLKVMGQSVFHEHDDPASTTPEVWRDINEAVALDLLSQLSEAQGKVREMEARLAASGLHVRGLQKSFDELRSKTDSWAANQAEIEQQLGVAAGPHGATLRDWRDLIAKVRQESEAQLAELQGKLAYAEAPHEWAANRIQELEAQLAERDARIAELETQLAKTDKALLGLRHNSIKSKAAFVKLRQAIDASLAREEQRKKETK